MGPNIYKPGQGYWTRTMSAIGFGLVEADTCCAPGYEPVTLSNRSADQPAFVFIADESPLHRKLGVYETR